MTWAKLPTGLRVAVGLMVATVLCAVGVAIGLNPDARRLWEARLDAVHFRFGLMALSVAAMALALLVPALARVRGRCLIAAIAPIQMASMMGGVDEVTPSQVASGLLLLAVVGFLALGRFEPKTPEPRP